MRSYFGTPCSFNIDSPEHLLIKFCPEPLENLSNYTECPQYHPPESPGTMLVVSGCPPAPPASWSWPRPWSGDSTTWPPSPTTPGVCVRLLLWPWSSSDWWHCHNIQRWQGKVRCYIRGDISSVPVTWSPVWTLDTSGQCQCPVPGIGENMCVFVNILLLTIVNLIYRIGTCSNVLQTCHRSNLFISLDQIWALYPIYSVDTV